MTNNVQNFPNHYSEQFSHSRVVQSSDFAVDRLYQYLTFTLYCRNNNLTYEAESYSKRQFVILGLILELQKQRLTYTQIADKFNSWRIKTSKQNAWRSASVHSVIKRYGQRVFRIEETRLKKYPSTLSEMSIIFDE
jgi:hypothetical protein